ncbi:hypothetical protein P3W43_01315 [Salinicola salarius]|uniref:hypothetical protein n=1 Tax=Salinicola salarius TaxID=430457 RepID=UPI0023E39C56|nr:hypothetical protein [Salinicola salarius]MDF3917488.1 hypothetical protein [Salinicola salarius]
MAATDTIDVNWETRYSMALIKRHIRFYRNLNGALTLLPLFAGSAVAANFINQSSLASSAFGLVVVLSTLAQFVVKPGEKRVALKAELQRYLAFLEILPTLDRIQSEAQFWAINKDDSDIIEGLQCVALHDTYLEVDGVVPPSAMQLTRWNRILRAAS